MSEVFEYIDSHEIADVLNDIGYLRRAAFVDVVLAKLEGEKFISLFGSYSDRSRAIIRAHMMTPVTADPVDMIPVAEARKKYPKIISEDCENYTAALAAYALLDKCPFKASSELFISSYEQKERIEMMQKLWPGRFAKIAADDEAALKEFLASHNQKYDAAIFEQAAALIKECRNIIEEIREIDAYTAFKLDINCGFLIDLTERREFLSRVKAYLRP